MLNRLLGRNDVRVNVKCMDGTVETFILAPTVGIAQFKNLVEQKLPACPAARQRLICRGKILHDEETIGTHIKEDGITIHVVVRPEAAPRSEPEVGQAPVVDTNLVDLLTRFIQSATQSAAQRQRQGEGMHGIPVQSSASNIMAVVVGGAGNDSGITQMLSQVLSQGLPAHGLHTARNPTHASDGPNADARISAARIRANPTIAPHSIRNHAGNERVNVAELPWAHLETAIRSVPAGPPPESSTNSLQSYMSRLGDLLNRVGAHPDPPAASIAALADILMVTSNVLNGEAEPNSPSMSDLSVRSARSLPSRLGRSSLSRIATHTAARHATTFSPVFHAEHSAEEPEQ